MIKAIVDPSIFAPPTQGSTLQWLQALRRWSSTLRDLDGDFVGAVMSRDSQANIAGITGGVTGLREALIRSGSPLGAPDVFKLIEAIRARATVPEKAFEPTEVVFSSLELSPSYANCGDDKCCEAFAEEIAHAATFTQETNVRVAAITTESAWDSPATEVAVKAEVEMWEMDGQAEVPENESGAISEAVPLWCSQDELESALREKWTELLPHPRLGIELAYKEINSSGTDDQPLQVTVGDQLVSSMQTMGYASKSGKIKAVFHAAAYIGSMQAGRLKSLEPHPYRKSAGGSSPAVERGDGAKLMRGKLGKGRNAHRLMWWDGASPEILGVVEHDANPMHLT